MSRISRLEIKNCLGISELEIQAGKVNIIRGGNERGKSSVLEVIEKGLRNTVRRTKFIKDGADEGTLYIELDDTTRIDRRVKPDGKESSKITQHGASIPKPETYLKSLVGDGFGFNPVDFMGQKDKDQTEILLSLIPMRVKEEDLREWFGEVPPVNLNQHAIDVLAYLAEKYFYDKRTIANSEVRECNNEIQSLFENLPDNYNGDEWREVNIGELWQAVQDGQKVNNLREQAQQIVNGLADKVSSIDTRYDLQIKEQKELLEFKIEKAKKSVEDDKQVIRDEITDREYDIAELEKEITKWEEMIASNRQLIEGHKLNILNLNDKLNNVDTQIVATKIESLNNEHAIELKNIEEKRLAEIGEARNKANDAQAYLDTKEVVVLEPLQQKAQEAEKMKGFISLYDQMQRHRDSLQTKLTRAAHLNECVDIARNKPAELLQSIELPIKGLGINDQMQLAIDGLPISNLSTSRQIKFVLDVARATAGPLKLICVDRFESLDRDQQEIFLKEIENDDFQYFITCVTGGELGVETREGSVA